MYKSKINLPVAIKTLLTPIFWDLSSDKLLSKCLQGTTQNPNEAFNQIIWQKCPKSNFVSREVLEIGVSSAVICYNDGFYGLNMIFGNLGIEYGSYFRSDSQLKDNMRIKNMDKKTEKEIMQIRKINRGIRKGYIDTDREKEGGDSYATGSH